MKFLSKIKTLKISRRKLEELKLRPEIRKHTEQEESASPKQTETQEDQRKSTLSSTIKTGTFKKSSTQKEQPIMTTGNISEVSTNDELAQQVKVLSSKIEAIEKMLKGNTTTPTRKSINSTSSLSRVSKK